MTPQIGDTHTFRQYRDCFDKHGNPGPCHSTVYTGTVSNVIHWADNSIDVEVLCDDGITRKTEVRAPHGDVCF